MRQNPLELGAAAIFAALFVLASLLSTWVKTKFGLAGIYSLAATPSRARATLPHAC